MRISCGYHMVTTDAQGRITDRGYVPNVANLAEEVLEGMGKVKDIPCGRHGMIHLRCSVR